MWSLSFIFAKYLVVHNCGFSKHVLATETHLFFDCEKNSFYSCFQQFRQIHRVSEKMWREHWTTKRESQDQFRIFHIYWELEELKKGNVTLQHGFLCSAYSRILQSCVSGMRLLFLQIAINWEQAAKAVLFCIQFKSIPNSLFTFLSCCWWNKLHIRFASLQLFHTAACSVMELPAAGGRRKRK